MQRHLGSGQIQGGMPPAGRHKDLSGQTGRPKVRMKDYQELTDGQQQKIEVPKKEIIIQTLAFNEKAVGLGEGNNDKMQKLEPILHAAIRWIPWIYIMIQGRGFETDMVNRCE